MEYYYEIKALKPGWRVAMNGLLETASGYVAIAS